MAVMIISKAKIIKIEHDLLNENESQNPFRYD